MSEQNEELSYRPVPVSTPAMHFPQRTRHHDLRYTLHSARHRAPLRIAVFRALQLGDMLLAVPALRALRQHFPGAEITLIGLPWAASFVSRYAHYIDRFVEFKGYPGIDEVPLYAHRVERFLAEQRTYHYDLVIQMHGSGRTSNSFARFLGAPITVGYYEPGRMARASRAGLTCGLPYPDGLHEIERNLGLVELVIGAQTGEIQEAGRPQGIAPTIPLSSIVGAVPCGRPGTLIDTRLEFPLFAEDYAGADELLRSISGKRPIIGIHAGARPPARRWPAASFAALADALVQRFDAQILLTGGPGEEQTVQAVERQVHTSCLSVHNLVGKTTLGTLAALLTRLDLFISNDTGPSHVACAVACPSVTIFGPADYERWRPLDTTRHLTVRHPVSCSPCGYWECPIDHRCLRWITPDDVLGVAQQLLTRNIHV